MMKSYIKFDRNSIVGRRLKVGIKNLGCPVYRGRGSDFFERMKNSQKNTLWIMRRSHRYIKFRCNLTARSSINFGENILGVQSTRGAKVNFSNSRKFSKLTRRCIACFILSRRMDVCLKSGEPISGVQFIREEGGEGWIWRIFEKL